MELFDIKFIKCETDLRAYKDEVLFDTTSSWDWEPSADSVYIYFEEGNLIYNWELTYKPTGEKIPFTIVQGIDSQDYAHDLDYDTYSFDVEDIDEEIILSDLEEIVLDRPIPDCVDQSNISNKALAALRKVENDNYLNGEFWEEIFTSMDV